MMSGGESISMSDSRRKLLAPELQFDFRGSDRITADDVAAHTRTIAYEVLCAIGARVPRHWQ